MFSQQQDEQDCIFWEEGSEDSNEDFMDDDDELIENILEALNPLERCAVENEMKQTEAFYDITDDLSKGERRFNIWTQEMDIDNNNRIEYEKKVQDNGARYWLDYYDVDIQTSYVAVRFVVAYDGSIQRMVHWCNPGTKYKDIPSAPSNTIFGNGAGHEFHCILVGEKGRNLIDLTEKYQLSGAWHYRRTDMPLDAYILAGNTCFDTRGLACAVDELTGRAFNNYYRLFRSVHPSIFNRSRAVPRVTKEHHQRARQQYVQRTPQRRRASQPVQRAPYHQRRRAPHQRRSLQHVKKALFPRQAEQTMRFRHKVSK